MTDTPTAKPALARLAAAVARLESALGSRQEALRDTADLEDEIQHLNNDRARLADDLDKEKHKAVQLSEANADVSRRLVAAMENIRSILERSEPDT